MKKEKRTLIVIFILYICTLIYPISNILTVSDEADVERVALFNLPLRTHLVIIYIVWPLLLTIICVILFPLIFPRLFLKVKGKVFYKYKNAFLNLEEPKLNTKKYIKRSILIFLLTMGLSATILSVLNFKPSWLISKTQADVYDSIGITTVLYMPEVILGLAYLVYPFAIGLWSVAWALEDSGLMHYKLPKEGQKKLYEIEPVYLKFNATIKGYAGVSAIIFYVAAIIYYITNEKLLASESGGMQLAFVFSIGSLLMFNWLPAFVVYSLVSKKIATKMLTKNLKEIKMVYEKEFLNS